VFLTNSKIFAVICTAPKSRRKQLEFLSKCKQVLLHRIDDKHVIYFPLTTIAGANLDLSKGSREDVGFYS